VINIINLQGKFKAGALQFVLFIGVVVLILLMSFVTLSYTHTFFSKRTTNLMRMTKKVDLGLSHLLHTNLAFRDTLLLPLDFQDGIMVKGFKDHWGLFEKHMVISSFRNQRLSKTVLVGAKKQKEPVLYLQDMERPLIVVGSTRIVGDALLPKQGVRPGNISGTSFNYQKLIDGRIGQSSQTLPSLDWQLSSYLNQIASLGPSNGFAETFDLEPSMILENSFEKPTLRIAGSVIDLSGISLTGNIIVIAENNIILDASSNLTDVILVAPTVYIGDGVAGRFQTFATKQIKVGKGCTLAYPSALTLKSSVVYNNANGQANQSGIAIAANSYIGGIIFYQGPDEGNRFSAQVAIEQNTVVNGELYCNQNLELKGVVNGYVSTRAFIALENGSIYQNHLFNGIIDNTKISPEYSGLLYNEANIKSIVQWLY
jgi:hypothetical protein